VALLDGSIRVLAGLALVTASCQTLAPREVKPLPAALESRFQACFPGDGAFQLEVFEDTRVLVSADIDWVARRDGTWTAELVTPVGFRLAAVHWKASRVSVEGRLAASLPVIDVDGEGFLTLDGHRIGLRPAELPCLFAGRLPHSWVSSVTEVAGDEEERRVEIEERGRDVRVDFGQGAPSSRRAFCARIDWSVWLGIVTSGLSWCEGREGTRVSRITSDGDYSVRWTRIDD
jgi:hypothetical protein